MNVARVKGLVPFTLGSLGVLGVVSFLFMGTVFAMGCNASTGSTHDQMSSNHQAAAPATASFADSKPPQGVPQTVCPIMGGKINKSIYADYEGKRVYFCCGGCPAEFKKDPAKYIKEMEAKGIGLDKTPI